VAGAFDASDMKALAIVGGNNGTLQGGAIATAVGEVGEAFALDGANQDVYIPESGRN